ncbi:MAG: hypothetical protein F6K42_24125 [Leptolyngbya sp. SIO1D8]|nr:hypothetical protein [Leptolyngbya sp. SIO1D8]
MMPPSASSQLALSSNWEILSASPTLPTPSSAKVTHSNTAVVIAQFDQDILGDLSTAFQNFIDSGQVWALIIGIVLGYVVRGITTYK